MSDIEMELKLNEIINAAQRALEVLKGNDCNKYEIIHRYMNIEKKKVDEVSEEAYLMKSVKICQE